MSKVNMLTYIEQTPKQLAYNNGHYQKLVQPLVKLFMKHNYRNLWLVASGSSNNGAMCAKPFLTKYLSCHVHVVAPNTFLYSSKHLDEDDFVVAISQSGCSTNVNQVLKQLQENNIPAIALTGNLDSDIVNYSDQVIDYGVGKETVGYVTLGVCTLVQFLVLFALSISYQKGLIDENKYQTILNELYEIPLRHEIMQQRTRQFYQANRYELTSMQIVNFCGFLQAYGIALEAALKIGETVKIPSFAYEAEEFIHGPNLQLTPNYTVFVIDDFTFGSQRIKQIYQAVKTVSQKTYFITNQPIDDQRVLVVPFEMKEPLLAPIYLLPIFQIIAFNVSDALNTWNSHPLFKDFKTIAATKTAKIKDIMKD